MSETMAGLQETLRNLATIRVEIRPSIRGVVRDLTIETQSSARAAAPVRTGILKDAIQIKFFDDGDTGVVFVAPRDDWRIVKDGYLRKGNRRAANFPLWVEYGTAKWRGRPFLMPAFRSRRAAFSERALEVVRRLVEGQS